MAERIKLGGLWLNKTKDGREYLTGKLSPSVKILIFKNNFRNAENQPSHIMYLAPSRPRRTPPRNAATAGAGGESFFSSEVPDAADPGDADEDEEGADFRPAAPPRPAPGTGGAPNRAAGGPPSRPAAGPPPAAAARRGNRPASGSGDASAPRRPAPRPAPEDDPDLSDLDDPFAE
jgi:hypothetical protein